MAEPATRAAPADRAARRGQAEAAARPAPAEPGTLPVLRRGCRFDGLVAVAGPVRIDGTVRGEVVATGPVWVGESGRLEGRLEADQIVVAGEVQGELRARSSVRLLATARVCASVETPSLSLEEGAQLEGRCRAGPVGPPAAES
jgi:cytoskeletal protein CcmA (bactofilin family)